jgi:patatin-like phospholipase/acyl hydrolase
MNAAPAPMQPARRGEGAEYRTILSIDGGGIRGIIPAVVLAEIERCTNRPIADLFHLIAGTSTGGILAVGLTVPGDNGRPKFTANDMIELYVKHGGEIFTKQWWRRTLALVAGSAYPAGPLEGLLKQYAGDTRLSEAVTGLLVTSWELRTRTAWFFRRAQAITDPSSDRPMHLIARATSAAPTYFPPLRVPDPSGDFALVDGGLFANNPSMAAWVDAHEGVASGQKVFLVSLGTGDTDDPITYGMARLWGKLWWARPIISVVLDGASDTVQYELRRTLPPRDYYRFQTKVPKANRSIDDTTLRNLDALQSIARSMIEAQKADFDAICARLQELAGK